jgi:hypothetical protein
MIPNPSALEAAISKALGSLGELTDLEIAEIRAYQTSLAESLVADAESVIRLRREAIEANAKQMQDRLDAATKEYGIQPWMEKTMADYKSSTQLHIDRMEYDLHKYADELKSPDSHR